MPVSTAVAFGSLSERVASQVHNLIVEEDLTPGDRLPTQRLLAERFNVSRTVIREAIKLLEARGIIDGRMGSGTFVADGNSLPASQFLGQALYAQPREVVRRKVFQVRRVLEAEVAALAAENASDEDISELRSILSQQERARPDRAAFEALDARFHETLARATKNECFVLMLAPLAHLLLETREWVEELPGELEGVLWHHAHILELVQAHDGPAARDAMHEHIRQATQLELTWGALARKAGLNDAARTAATGPTLGVETS